MQKITRAKNADYTGKGDDPFANFRKIEALTNGAVSVEAGFLTRMSDKFSRIGALMTQEAQVKDESVIDTLLDLANYSALLAGYLQSKNPVICPHKNVFVEKGSDTGQCVDCGLHMKVAI